VCAQARRLWSLGLNQGFANWTVFGTFQYGVAMTQLGELEEGIALMRQGLNEYFALGSDMFRPSQLAPLALALVETGAVQQGMELLNEALATSRRTGERWYEAELYRLKGRLLLLPDDCRTGADAASEAVRAKVVVKQAERCYLQAIAVARRQHARLWELRAAMDLARLWRDQGRRQQALALLAPVYDWFSEGFATADLQQARVLLDELATRQASGLALPPAAPADPPDSVMQA
jgi:predicted ATPase